MIAGLTGHYNERIENIQRGKIETKQEEKKRGPPPVYRHPIYLNNPNFIKKKRLILTKNAECQTTESEFAARLSEQAIENKVAQKLVQMLISKGVSKIIKKYGYLPVDYLKNEGNVEEVIE